ncbi:MAG TPA: hypothetical protein VLR47_00545 [Rhodospirillales bacterium]|nr:hypothetical protein [Rhodospirillales bacterium]
MLSKIDIRDFFEINQGLYDEPASARQLALLQALTQALDQAAVGHRPSAGSRHDDGQR